MNAIHDERWNILTYLFFTHKQSKVYYHVNFLNVTIWNDKRYWKNSLWRVKLCFLLYRDIIIEHDELHPGKTSHLKDIGLKIFTPDNFKLHSLSFLCRRVRPEFCADSLKPVGKEILISDAFEYITSTVHVNGEVDLEVPLYDHPDPYEIIQIKSNVGNIEDPSAIVEGPTTYNEVML